VLAGSRSFTAIGEWVLDASPQVWAAFGVRCDPLSRRFEPPDEATIRRVVEEVDGDALDAAIGSWLAGVLAADRSARLPAGTPAAPCRPGVWQAGVGGLVAELRNPGPSRPSRCASPTGPGSPTTMRARLRRDDRGPFLLDCKVVPTVVADYQAEAFVGH
jgi:hypothetical protein